jgi:hypothetical protein
MFPKMNDPVELLYKAVAKYRYFTSHAAPQASRELMAGQTKAQRNDLKNGNESYGRASF